MAKTLTICSAKVYKLKLLYCLNNLHLNGHILGFDPQTLNSSIPTRDLIQRNQNQISTTQKELIFNQDFHSGENFQ